MPPDRDEFDTLPPALVAELRRLDRELNQPSVPTHVDAAMRAEASAHFQAVEQADAPAVLVFPAWARWAGRVAAAAAIAAGAGLWWVGLDAGLSGNATTAQGPTGDINNDGQRNIVDAMVLAQSLRNTTSNTFSADINNDGLTNTLDVEALAQHVVSLRDQWTRNATDELDASDATQHAFVLPLFALEPPAHLNTPSGAADALEGGA